MNLEYYKAQSIQGKFALNNRDYDMLGIVDLNDLTMANTYFGCFYIFYLPLAKRDKNIGFIKLNYNYVNQVCNIELMYVDFCERRKGYASEMIKLIIPIIFSYGFQKITIATEADNCALNLYKKFFKHEGIITKHTIKNGKRIDRIIFGLNIDEVDVEFKMIW